MILQREQQYDVFLNASYETADDYKKDLLRA